MARRPHLKSAIMASGAFSLLLACHNGGPPVAPLMAGNGTIAGSHGKFSLMGANSTIVTTLAGSGSYGDADGPGTTAQFESPSGLAVDRVGNVYVADEGDCKIRKITPDGVVSTLAGDGNSGWVDAIGAAAEFQDPQGVAVDQNGNLYVADNPVTGSFSTIRKVSPGGEVSTVYYDGSPDSLWGVAADSFGNVFFSSAGYNFIKKLDPKVPLTGPDQALLFAGGINNSTFNEPRGLTVDANGNLYVVDQAHRSIKNVTPAGSVSSVASLPDSNGRYIAIDNNGSLFVTDGNIIYRLDPGGGLQSYAGSGITTQTCTSPSPGSDGGARCTTDGFADGPGATARFFQPSGIAVDTVVFPVCPDTFSLGKWGDGLPLTGNARCGVRYRRPARYQAASRADNVGAAKSRARRSAGVCQSRA